MDQAAARGLREQSVHIFNHFKKEIDRDNATKKSIYGPLAILAETTSQKRSTVPFVTETLYGIEGLMSKLQMIISLHIDIGLREISKNLRLMCKEQADLMDKILVETRTSLWFYVFSLNSVYNVLKNQHVEKQIYADKAYRLAKTVKELTHINEKTAKDETILQMLEELYPDEKKNEESMSEQEILESDRSEKQKAGAIKKLNAKQKQLLVDTEIQMAIELIENNPQLSEEDKAYRKCELMKSRRSGGGMVGTDAHLSAKYGAAGGFVETIFAPGIGFIERVSAKKLERWIRELKLELVRAKEHEMTDAERAYAEMERIKKSMEEQMEERKMARSNFSAHIIQKRYRSILFTRRVHRRYLRVRVTKIQRVWVKYNIIRRMRWGVRRVLLEEWAARTITKYMQDHVAWLRLRLKSACIIRRRMRDFAKYMQRVRQSTAVRNIVLRQSLLREEYQMAKQKLRLTRLEQLLVELYPKEVTVRMAAPLTTNITTKYGHESHRSNLSVKELASQSTDIRTAYLRSTSNFIKTRVIETEKDADALEVTRRSMERVGELRAGDMLSCAGGGGNGRTHDRFKEKFTSASTAAEALDAIDVDYRQLNEPRGVGSGPCGDAQNDRTDVSSLFRKLELMDKKMHSFTRSARDVDRKGLRQVKLGRELVDLLDGVDGPPPSRPSTGGALSRTQAVAVLGGNTHSTATLSLAPPESVVLDPLMAVVVDVLPHFNAMYSDRRCVEQLLRRHSEEVDKDWLEAQSLILLEHLSLLLVQQGLLFYPDLEAFRTTSSNADIIPLVSPLTSVLAAVRPEQKLSAADTGQLALECDHWHIPSLQSDIDYLTSYALYTCMPVGALGTSTQPVQSKSRALAVPVAKARRGGEKDSLNNASVERRTVRARVKDCFLLGLTTLRRPALLTRLFLTVAKHSSGVAEAGGIAEYVARFCTGLYGCSARHVWAGPQVCKLLFTLLFGLGALPSSGLRFHFPRSTPSGAIVQHEARWGTNCLFLLYIYQLAGLLRTKVSITGTRTKGAATTTPHAPLSPDAVTLQTAVNIVQYCCCQLPEAKWKPVSAILLKLELYSPVIQSLLGAVFEACGLDLAREASGVLQEEERDRVNKRDTREAMRVASAALHQGADDDSAAGVEQDEDEDDLEIDSVDPGIMQRPRPPSASAIQRSNKQRTALQHKRWMVQQKQLEAVAGSHPPLRTDDSSEYSNMKLQHSRHHLPSRGVTSGELELDLLLANSGPAGRAKSAPGLRSPKPKGGSALACGDLEAATLSMHALALALLPFHVEQSARAYREFCLNTMFRAATGCQELAEVGAPLTRDAAPVPALSSASISRARFVEYLEEELVFDVNGQACAILAAFGVEGKLSSPAALQPATYSPNVLLDVYDANILKCGETEMHFGSFVDALLCIIQTECNDPS